MKVIFLGRLFVISIFLKRFSVDAHGYLKTPRARNYIAWKEGVWSGGDSTKYPKEDCPHCANIGGTAGQCGVIGSKNYVQNLNIYGGPMPANPQETYVQGQTIFVDIVLTAHHMGHFEFKACPIVDSSSPSTTGQEQEANAACFDSFPLEFVSDPWYNAPRHDEYPLRAYIAPPDVSRKDGENGVGLIYRFELKLPSNLVGDWILLQWHYFTANSCIYPGYTSYPYPSEWGTFTTGTSICDDIPSDGRGLPEQFWNCAEITVTPRSGTGDSDVSTPIPSSSVSPTEVTEGPTFYPSTSPIVVTSSPSSTSSESMCGNGSIGNGKCPDNSMCCSHLGWCGTGELYCKPTYDKATKSPSTTEQSTNAPSQAPKNEPISPVTTSESLTIPFPDYANGDCSNGNEKSRMKINVGYYQSWAIYRESGCNPVWPDDIDIEKHGYTHLIYAFASINSTYQLEPWDGNYKDEVPLYEALNALKSKYPKLKTMIAVGGWTFNDPGDTETRFSDTARTSARRKAFAASCVEFCRQFNFDGVDLDWEYPGDVNRGGSSVDKRNYGSLLEAIRTAFDESSMELELSMASAIASYRLDFGYDLSTLAKYLDFFNLMTYDIHGTWDVPKVVDAHTDMKYIFKSVQYFLDAGVPSTKLVLGLAAYGRTYNLEDESCTLAGCPFSSAGEGGCAGEKGFMPYFTIDEYVQGKNLKSLTFNAETGSMELVLKDNVWISYDTPQTLQLKYDFASQSCFRGIMWWAVDMLTSRQEALVILDTLPQDTTTPAFPAPSKLDVDWTKWTVSTDSRCGISELDARGHCRKTCISDDDCNTVEGHTCFKVHDNYCDSKPDCTLPDDLDVKSYPLALRCGPTELVARELCGKPCQSYDDCDGENGEYCFVVNPNFCDASCV